MNASCSAHNIGKGNEQGEVLENEVLALLEKNPAEFSQDEEKHLGSSLDHDTTTDAKSLFSIGNSNDGESEILDSEKTSLDSISVHSIVKDNEQA